VALSADVAALAGRVRDSAGEGERAAAAWVAGRLREAGAAEVALEPYRWPRTYAWAHALHLAAGLAGGPVALAALASFELEVSGRGQWLHRVLPAGQGSTVVARVPAAGPARRTVVLVAHLDAARTGAIWRIGARLRTPATVPATAPAGLAFALAALPRGPLRTAGRALLAVGLAAYADTAASPTVPGANDNATGVAALIELTRRLATAPAAGTEVLVVAPGAEEAGMGGMRAFLRAHAGELAPARTFVLNLDTLGSGTPAVATHESTLLPHAYRGEDVARVEAAAARAGVALRRFRAGAFTDGILAVFAGLPAASLLSLGPGDRYANYHLPGDTADGVDPACLEACVAVAEQVVRG
jgi:hypothetical protein